MHICAIQVTCIQILHALSVVGRALVQKTLFEQIYYLGMNKLYPVELMEQPWLMEEKNRNGQ